MGLAGKSRSEKQLTLKQSAGNSSMAGGSANHKQAASKQLNLQVLKELY